MAKTDPHESRAFALKVVQKLREAGFEALWAGGCVRDQLLGRPPKDYDVATSARPAEVRKVFGHRRTIPIGASFGVITVLGPQNVSQVEVATFRRDAAYSDGRHPDQVTFSTAEEDAQRRDFTINGLFFDPVDERVIDYVGGQQDLQRRVIRAIGDAEARFAEDKLRMLRAVRFAARFDFQLDRATKDSIRRHALELSVVSAERIAAEMREILTIPGRTKAMQWLAQTGLLGVVLPEASALSPPMDQLHGSACEGRVAWHETMSVMRNLEEPDFATALAALLRGIANGEAHSHGLIDGVARRWKLSTAEVRKTSFFMQWEATVRQADQIAWPTVQRTLVAEDADSLVNLAAAVVAAEAAPRRGVEFCRKKLALPREVLDPPPLISGNDLAECGFEPGPQFASMLSAVRDAQLNGQITTKDDALALAQELAKS